MKFKKVTTNFNTTVVDDDHVAVYTVPCDPDRFTIVCDDKKADPGDQVYTVKVADPSTLVDPSFTSYTTSYADVPDAYAVDDSVITFMDDTVLPLSKKKRAK